MTAKRQSPITNFLLYAPIKMEYLPDRFQGRFTDFQENADVLSLKQNKSLELIILRSDKRSDVLFSNRHHMQAALDKDVFNFTIIVVNPLIRKQTFL